MNNRHISRRTFVKNSALLAASLPLAPAASVLGQQSASATGREDISVPLSWLGEGRPSLETGATWGVPWPRGKVAAGTSFSLSSEGGDRITVQTWPLAYWPDGSLKWTAHAAVAGLSGADRFRLEPGAPLLPAEPLTVAETPEYIRVDTGTISCTVSKGGRVLIPEITRAGVPLVVNGRLVLFLQDGDGEPGRTVSTELFEGEISSVTAEQTGPVRACVRIEGKHASPAGRRWLPFTIRLYFYSGSDAIRMVHTIVFDGDENKDFIKGLGFRFNVPLKEELHDRHIRFAGEDRGVFYEAVRGLTGLRRDPGEAVRKAQTGGRSTPPVSSFPETVSKNIRYIPAFGDYTLLQPSAGTFEIRKRTRKGYSWVHAASGRRAGGLGYAGTPSGGVAFGIRNFWQSFPAQLDIRNAASEAAEITMWLQAADANAMDLRFYHDGMGQDTYQKQRDALDITYEDYEPGFATPLGVARTSEIMLFVLGATPSNDALLQMSSVVQAPPLLVSGPQHLLSAGVFGSCWSLPDRSSVAKATIEDKLERYFTFYRDQVDQRGWYGFWNYGDVMHSYDEDRHVWKYDVGGFAWDNSELSTDLWLWYYFLRTGRVDVFRMAEAMTRHTGEVDVHHLGPFAPLGSRHNVMHWGDSAKQLRISTAANRRFYYYLTGDERTGDLLREQVGAVDALSRIQPNRKIRSAATDISELEVPVSFGTDWGAVAAAWLTEWERTGDRQMRDKLLNSMRTIAAQHHGFLTGSSVMDIRTGKFTVRKDSKPVAHHLNAVFGLAEVCFELVGLVDMPAFRRAWLQYCELYNAPEEEQVRRLGQSLGKLNLRQGHSRLSAFVAQQTGNKALGRRAWTEFYHGTGGIRGTEIPSVRRLEGPEVLRPVDEIDGISTNGTAQWCLAAMQCLAFAGAQGKQ